MAQKKDLVTPLLGKKFNMLTILRRAFGKIKEGARVIVICECGNEKNCRISHVVNGDTKSCGCLNIKLATKHGLTSHPLYSTYYDMMHRCYKEKYKGYEKYGGEGVFVCKEWRDSFIVFYDWAINNGWVKGLQLDKDILSKKLGISKRYSPETCQFVTGIINSRNRSNNAILYSNGQSKCITEWAEGLGINSTTLRERISRGWPIDQAVSLKKNTKLLC